jgi:hypothetical protein
MLSNLKKRKRFKTKRYKSKRLKDPKKIVPRRKIGKLYACAQRLMCAIL